MMKMFYYCTLSKQVKMIKTMKSCSLLRLLSLFLMSTLAMISRPASAQVGYGNNNALGLNGLGLNNLGLDGLGLGLGGGNNNQQQAAGGNNVNNGLGYGLGELIVCRFRAFVFVHNLIVDQ